MRNGFPREQEISGMFRYNSVLFSLNILFTHWMWSHRHEQFVLTLWSVSPPNCFFFFTVEHLYGITLLNVCECDFVSVVMQIWLLLLLYGTKLYIQSINRNVSWPLVDFGILANLSTLWDIVEIFSEIIDSLSQENNLRISRVTQNLLI